MDTIFPTCSIPYEVAGGGAKDSCLNCQFLTKNLCSSLIPRLRHHYLDHHPHAKSCSQKDATVIHSRWPLRKAHKKLANTTEPRASQQNPPTSQTKDTSSSAIHKNARRRESGSKPADSLVQPPSRNRSRHCRHPAPRIIRMPDAHVQTCPRNRRDMAMARYQERRSLESVQRRIVQIADP
jgi:hypothetical protein